MSGNSNKNNDLRFHDDVAARTKWAPLSWAGHKFQDYHGLRTDEFRYEFKVTKNLYRYILKLPIFLTLVGVFLFLTTLSTGFDVFLTFMFIGFLPITGIGTSYFYYKALRRPFIFDTKVGYFWKGNYVPGEGKGNKIRICIKLDEIYALQILHNRVKNFLNSYHCYELNLVFKDGSRQIVLNHADIEMMQKDAENLACFLEVPLWDNTIDKVI